MDARAAASAPAAIVVYNRACACVYLCCDCLLPRFLLVAAVAILAAPAAVIVVLGYLAVAPVPGSIRLPLQIYHLCPMGLQCAKFCYCDHHRRRAREVDAGRGSREREAQERALFRCFDDDGNGSDEEVDDSDGVRHRT